MIELIKETNKKWYSNTLGLLKALGNVYSFKAKLVKDSKPKGISYIDDKAASMVTESVIMDMVHGIKNESTKRIINELADFYEAGDSTDNLSDFLRWYDVEFKTKLEGFELLVDLINNSLSSCLKSWIEIFEEVSKNSIESIKTESKKKERAENSKKFIESVKVSKPIVKESKFKKFFTEPLSKDVIKTNSKTITKANNVVSGAVRTNDDIVKESIDKLSEKGFDIFLKQLPKRTNSNFDAEVVYNGELCDFELKTPSATGINKKRSMSVLELNNIAGDIKNLLKKYLGDFKRDILFYNSFHDSLWKLDIKKMQGLSLRKKSLKDGSIKEDSYIIYSEDKEIGELIPRSVAGEEKDETLKDIESFEKRVKESNDKVSWTELKDYQNIYKKFFYKEHDHNKEAMKAKGSGEELEGTKLKRLAITYFNSTYPSKTSMLTFFSKEYDDSIYSKIKNIKKETGVRKNYIININYLYMQEIANMEKPR